jgi:hypothetical protein
MTLFISRPTSPVISLPAFAADGTLRRLVPTPVARRTHRAFPPVDLRWEVESDVDVPALSAEPDGLTGSLVSELDDSPAAVTGMLIEHHLLIALGH